MPATHLELFLKLVQLIDIRVWYFQILFSQNKRLNRNMWVEAEAENGYLEVFRSGRKVKSPLVLLIHISLPHSTSFIANQLWYAYG